jgi:hypothetical protein
MPGGDRTGPLGAGPMTGRGAGYCAGYAAPGYANPFGGRGWFGRGRRFGRGRGWFGRGWRHWYGPGPGWVPYAYGDPYYSGYVDPTYPHGRELSTSDEMTMLREQSEFLQNELKEIQERIGTLEKAQTQEKK